ncbi:hypothetical protein WME94_06330 [Sorangium sp. So ce429]
MKTLEHKALAACEESEQVIFAPQKYATFRFNYDTGIRYIGTWGLAPCVGLVLYDATSCSGMVSHFDSDAAELSSRNSARHVAEGLFREFRAGAGRNPSAAYIVQGTAYDVEGVTTKATLFTVCEDYGLTPELVTSRSGDLILSLRTGALFGINYNLGVSPQHWVRLAIAMNRSSNGAIKTVRLETPVTVAARYAAP